MATRAPRADDDAEPTGARPARLWRRGRQERRYQQGTIIAKLRTPPSARRIAASLRAGAAVAGPALQLSRLVENGYARTIEPVFPAAVSPFEATRGARFLASTVEPERPVTRARGLVEIKVEPGTDARELVRHVERLGDEVEYAYVPAVRRVFGGASRRRTRPDPLISRQWAHGAVRIARARQARGFDAAGGVVVAVVDSGIDKNHPDLVESIAGYANFVDGEGDRDYIGHGTHVAGIISAGIENGVGIAGLCAAKVLAIKALPRRDEDWDATAYYRALAHCIGRARVLNLSLGGDTLDPGERDVIRDILDAGIVVVAAMGNEYEDGNPTEYPAAIDGVCAVGATDQMDRRGSFSNTGRHIALCAPGVEILSTTPTYDYDGDGRRSYDSWDGTSMATPHVAAAAALVVAKDTSVSPAQVVRRLTRSADRTRSMRRRPGGSYGWGRLNIEAALA